MDSCARSRPGAGLIRAFLLTWLSVVLSACGHSVATGAAPSWVAVGIGSTAVSLAAAPFTRRRTSVLANAGALAAFQVGLHVFFTAAMPTGATAHAMGPAHEGMVPPTWVALLPTVPMLCGHLVAAAGVAWLLHGGDAAMARVVELAGPYGSEAVQRVRHAFAGRLSTRQPCPEALTALSRRTTPRWSAAPRSPRSRLVHEVTRRGPPRRAAALG
ncbi:hypothetical protein [Streptomyces sp. NPDC093111]|uniref:hypothetical protein n=1 Tax=Streptomyces sp. NPDC093111 TaxID=3154978 RepID=UPI003442EDE0